MLISNELKNAFSGITLDVEQVDALLDKFNAKHCREVIHDHFEGKFRIDATTVLLIIEESPSPASSGEGKVFKSVCEACYNGYCADLSQISESADIEPLQVKGYLSSLDKKGLINIAKVKRNGTLFSDIFPSGKYTSFISAKLSYTQWSNIWQSRILIEG